MILDNDFERDGFSIDLDRRITDRAQDEGGNQVFGYPNGVPYKNCKAGHIECWMTAT